ncbi:HAD family hydrolase [Shimia marina]|uniref:Fructose-1-phosphate phosphatase YqaB n=1 Tax=Shimia marina TaxID=321267 RepID=A0A0P1ESS2_9RHOB|nr:HAD family phosphatase [Shimia marina]CUH53586.1 Fructose-1-phosphate phosphatase YqaB [Shimia marina]SFD73544.1 haloacid dehalogenase superfamily, subfamily IA, variant 3 with third motif having DD or ED [Shimia marina]
MRDFPTSPEAFDACLFDMDGLLLDTERMFMRSFVALTSDLDIAPSEAEAFFITLVGTSAAETTRRLGAFLPSGVDIAGFDLVWRENHAANAAQGIALKPYVLEVLSALHVRNIPMAVVTSTAGCFARKHLKHAGLLRFFDAVCAGDEVRANKPHPEPYLTGAALLGVDAARCVAFEDSDLGTRAAIAAGCATFQIPDLRPTEVPVPDIGQKVVTHLGEAARHIGVLEEGF